MMFCARCNAVFHGGAWLGKYCSRGCAYDDNRRDWDDCAPLYDPTDPTGERVIASNRDEVQAMLELAAIDKRLPRIVYLRGQGKTLREIGRACGMCKDTAAKLLRKSTHNTLP